MRRLSRESPAAPCPGDYSGRMTDSDLVLHLGREELVIRRRYETLSIANDFLIALTFTVGSVFFFSESTMTAGTWLFLAGSLLLMVRPTIRLIRRVHLVRVGGPAAESARDF
ncbi:YrhK-like protein [Nesterenkonia sandarakina]|uniref:YrhK-like protein n=2 Tax=Nesterenkonia sandarakina TaxID=272918 RepID=A0A2T0YHJ8_9MICC|nr:YrhK-like protein [Nesterenkonia sandarakina]